MKTSLLFLVSFLSTAIVTGVQAQDLSPRVAQSLRYLPTDSEALAVEQKTFVVPAPPTQGRSEQLQLSREVPSVSNLQFGVIWPQLVGRTIELSLEERSHARPPQGFGLMPYDGSGLLYLKPQENETRQSLEDKVLKPAKKFIMVGSQRVGIFENKREYDLWRVYVAVPQTNTVLMATDRKSLETTLGRIKAPSSAANRAFPASWSGWKLVDTRAPFWGIRRLDLPGSHGFLDKPDETAKALVVFSQTAPRTPPYIIRYVGNTQRIRRFFEQIGRELPGELEVLPPSSVTQYTVSSGHEAMFTFYILGLLGTGVYV